MNKEEFMREVKKAVDLNKRYLCVIVFNGKGEEVIVNTTPNFESKAEYYNKAYNENMELIANTDIRITKVVCGGLMDVFCVLGEVNGKNK